MESVKKKKIYKNKTPEPEVFTGEFYQPRQEELTPIFLKLFQKIVEEEIYLSIHLFFFFEEGTLLNSLHKASKTLTPKSDKLPHTYTHKITGNITDEHRCKNPE